MITIRDCAAEYARYWVSKERHFVGEMGASDRGRQLAALRRASGYFKIARSFPLSFDVEAGLPRLGPVLAAIERISQTSVTPDLLGNVIHTLRRELGQAYGGRDLLSAATKFLWLTHRKVVVIFDSQARLALGTPYGDYCTYLEHWHSGYSKCLSEVQKASAEMASDAEALGLLGYGESDFREAASEDWFHRRVYDIHLWRTGKPAKSPERLAIGTPRGRRRCSSASLDRSAVGAASL